jgi:hypothetical protein
MALLLSLLLLIFLHCGAKADGSPSLVETVLLVTATNETKGVEIRLFTNGGFEQKDIVGRYLSPECGDRLRRCSELTVVSTADTANEQQIFVVVIPFFKGLGLVRFSPGCLSESETHVIDLAEKYNCSPAEIQLILDDYYIVCSNSKPSFTKLLKLKLNTTHLAQSVIPELDYLRVSPAANKTNFVYVHLPDHAGDAIYFANGHKIHYFRPTEFVRGQVDAELEEEDCFATAIAYVGDWQLIVYCNNHHAVYVDIDQEATSPPVDYSKDGRPYVCPNPDVYLGVYSDKGYVQYGFFSTNTAQNLEVPMSDYHNGVCLGSTNTTLFAFTDRERGTQFLNASSGSVISLSDSTCINYPCRPLLVLGGHYLALREKRAGDWHISLFDSHKNFSRVLEVGHSEADLMSVVEGVKVFTKYVSKVEPEVTIQERKPEGKSGIDKHIGVPLGVVGVFAIVCIAIILLLLWKRRRPKPRNDGTVEPIQEERKFERGVEELQGQPTSPEGTPSGTQEVHSGGEVREDDHLQNPLLPLTNERANKEIKKQEQLRS